MWFCRSQSAVNPIAEQKIRSARALSAPVLLANVLRFPRDPLGQVFLDKTRAQMDIHLNQWDIADGFEAVNLAGLDDEDIPGGAFKRLPVHGP